MGIKELKSIFYDIVVLDRELGVSAESVLDEVYDLWQRGDISGREFDAFFTFAKNTDRSRGIWARADMLMELRNEKSRTMHLSARALYRRNVDEKKKRRHEKHARRKAGWPSKADAVDMVLPK